MDHLNKAGQKHITVQLDQDQQTPLSILDHLSRLGFDTTPIDIDEGETHITQAQNRKLLRALAVAGFGAMNIMLLSVSTWSGANGSAKVMFHLISALIAIPTVLYAGQVFFISAIKALKNGHLNMDVPIALAVLLALIMSVYEALTHGDVVYFDASVSLLFFLLIGRYLDQMMRERARNAVNVLARRSVRGAHQILPDGTLNYRLIDEIEQGMVLQIRPGDKIPVDGDIMAGTSDLDLSLVTGESLPSPVKRGDHVLAGTHNISGSLKVIATRAADQSFLSEVSRMLEAAENGRGAYVRLADRMARIYAPLVHLLALLAFITWMIMTGGDWHTSIYIAISILIITCPCALGLAVPVVHVIAAGQLFERGILMKDGSALERLNEIDHVIFDKTGTLTDDQLVVSSNHNEFASSGSLIKALACQSHHPISKALTKYLSDFKAKEIADVKEEPGCGLCAIFEDKTIRLGSFEWVYEIAKKSEQTGQLAQQGHVFFAKQGHPIQAIALESRMRPDALSTLNMLKQNNLPIEILSGDNEHSVKNFANKLAISNFTGNAKPKDKLTRVSSLAKKGRKVLMVGDGINDAPSLAAGHASMAPASASDVGR